MFYFAVVMLWLSFICIYCVVWYFTSLLSIFSVEMEHIKYFNVMNISHFSTTHSHKVIKATGQKNVRSCLRAKRITVCCSESRIKRTNSLERVGISIAIALIMHTQESLNSQAFCMIPSFTILILTAHHFHQRNLPTLFIYPHHHLAQ